MNSATAMAGLVYAAAAYTLVYAAFALARWIRPAGVLGFIPEPYDGSHLVIRRRYV